MKKKLVVLTGAGMSAESGISTFRDSDGLWEKYRVEDVATPEGFAADPELVLNFYNQRRRELLNTKPNAGHIGLADLEQEFDVHIITQNIDNLHTLSSCGTAALFLGLKQYPDNYPKCIFLRFAAAPTNIYAIHCA